MKKRSWTIVTGLIVGLMIYGAGASWAADYYVAHNGQTSAVPYTTWATAGSNIQTVVDSLTTYGDTVWVGPGTYGIPPSPHIVEGTNVVFIDNNVSLRGFSGNPADTIIDAGGGTNNRGILIDTTDWHDNSVYLVDGFTVSNGYANVGGGIRFIFNNFVRTGIVQNCVIVNNTATGGGGGIYAYYTAAGPVFIASNTVVRGNTGGGIFKRSTDRTLITDCLIEGNTAYGFYCYAGDTLVERCVIRGNTNSGAWGGGLSFWYGTPKVRNSLIYDNYCGGSPAGGAMSLSTCTPEFYNCTIVSNGAAAGQVAGIYSHWNGNVKAWNTILYANHQDNGVVANGPPGDHWNGMAYFYFTNCCLNVTNGLIGTGNIESNPFFANPVASDFRLTKTSPCLNQGLYQSWMDGAKDLDGLPRIDTAWHAVDMGCYEYFPSGTLITVQ